MTVETNTFQILVDRYYAALYRFALSLSGKPEAAADLVQQTFFLWAEKGHQLRESSKAKSWLFTTLYREYLATYRRNVKFPQVEIDSLEEDIPIISTDAIKETDVHIVIATLAALDEVFRAPLTLFYIDELSYKDIADLLDVPIGTVMSRLSRGKAQLRKLLFESQSDIGKKIVDYSEKKGAA